MFPAFGHLGAVPYHISYATRDLDAAMEEVGGLLGLRWGEVSAGVLPGLGPGDTTGWETRRVLSLGGPVHLELSEGSPGSTWHTTERMTMHHLAYWCDDFQHAVRSMTGDGWTLELTLVGEDGAPSEFAYVSKEGWPRLELVDVQRAPAFVVAHAHTGAAAVAHGPGTRR